MNYHLFDDTLLLHVNQNDEENQEIMTGLSKVEDYSQYKGTERSSAVGDDYEAYAKIYIRADNRKVAIKRKYQDFMEFYADISGLLLSIFWVLGVIFAYYDRIKANHSISKKLFYFEGIKDNKFAQFNKIKEIIYDKNKEKEKEKENILPYEEEKNIRSPIGFNNISSYSIRNSQNKNLEVNLSQRNTNAKIIKENKENNDEENSIDYSNYNLFEMLMSFDFCYCKTKKFENKVNLMGQARNIIDGKLDIVYYIRNMILFEIINKINLENKNIINFLSRPIIYLSEKKENEKENENDNDDEPKDINLEEIETFTTSYDVDIGNKEEKKDDNNNLKKDDLYKSAYRLNSEKLIEKTEDLVFNEQKTKNQEKLIKLLKKHLKGV